MKIGLIYWLILLLWFLFGLFVYWPTPGTGTVAFYPLGGSLILFILLFLLGWKVFGWPIQE